MPYRELVEETIALAREAGRAILEVYAGDFEVRGKDDESPVTLADERAEDIILAGIARMAPGIPVVSEEAASAGRVPEIADRFWLVDPLDGTREFVQRNGEFTVNIALVDRGVPVLGVVHAPALDRVFAGAAGARALAESSGERRAIGCASDRKDGLVIVSSRSHGDAQALERFLGGRKVKASVGIGSSLKFCLVAEGAADLYPRLGRTMEWDTAAGHAVLSAAGGLVERLEGGELTYGKTGFVNPPFVARCRG
jgi:3'(2'), 5'-bisphosphate nucleotidase